MLAFEQHRAGGFHLGFQVSPTSDREDGVHIEHPHLQQFFAGVAQHRARRLAHIHETRLAIKPEVSIA